MTTRVYARDGLACSLTDQNGRNSRCVSVVLSLAQLIFRPMSSLSSWLSACFLSVCLYSYSPIVS